MDPEIELARISQDYYRGSWEFMVTAQQLIRYRSEGGHPTLEAPLAERLKFLRNENATISQRIIEIAEAGTETDEDSPDRFDA
jgi:hypothetical protein